MTNSKESLPCLQACQRSLRSLHPGKQEWNCAVLLCQSSEFCQWSSKRQEPTRNSRHQAAERKQYNYSCVWALINNNNLVLSFENIKNIYFYLYISLFMVNLNLALICFRVVFFVQNNILHKIKAVTWTILMMSLLPFWALKVSVALLPMQGKRALRFDQKHLNLCPEDEWRSYGFGTSSG